MNSKKKFIIPSLIFLLAAFFLFGNPGLGRAEFSSSEEREALFLQGDLDSTTVLELFLNTDSEVGEEQGQSLDLLLDFQKELEPELIAILLEGPDQKSSESFENYLDEQWSIRQEFLDGMTVDDIVRQGLSEDEAEIALSIQEEDFKDLYRRGFIQKYREKAAVGLAAIGSDEGCKFLLEILSRASEEEVDLRNIIALSIERFESCR